MVRAMVHGIGGRLTVREVLEAARDAALEIRLIEEQAEIRRAAIGVQGHSYEVHAKSGILDPMRKVDELLEWQEQEIDACNLRQPIDEAWDIVRGIARIADDLMVEVVTRYYLQGASWREILADSTDRIAEVIDAFDKLSERNKILSIEGAVNDSIDQWEPIGIAHLKEMGR